jgi:hypothetical protein
MSNISAVSGNTATVVPQQALQIPKRPDHDGDETTEAKAAKVMEAASQHKLDVEV